MDKDDRDNLKYMLETYMNSPEDLDKWFDTLSLDELNYAVALLSKYTVANQELINMLCE